MANAVVAAVKDTWGYRDLLRNLTQRELRSRYRRSFLGWGWSLLQPALMTAVYAVMLGYYLKVQPDPGNPSGIHIFAFFLLAGVLPWNFFQNSLMTGMGTIANAGALVTRVYFPRLLLPMSSILALAVTLLIELSILAVSVAVVTGHLMFHLIPVALVQTFLLVVFTTGITLWLTAVNVRYRDVEYITGILMLAAFYMTPILYSSSFIPAVNVIGSAVTLRDIALLNPMARFAIAYRDVFYDIRMPDVTTLLWLVFWAFISFYFGMRYFLRRSDYFAEMM